MRWGRIREIIIKELRQALREPRMRVLLFVPPVVQLLVFGFAVNLDVGESQIGWMDSDGTPASRDLLAAFDGSPYFHVTAVPASDAEVQHLLDEGSVRAVIRVLPGFGRELSRGETTTVQILVDGSNSNTAAIVSSYAGQVASAYGRKAMQEQLRDRLAANAHINPNPVRMTAPGLDIRSRVWFNPSLYSRYYFVPGVVVNIVALVTIMLTAMSIVREKEIGTMEQLMVTPIRPAELMVGKLLPFGMIGILEVILVTLGALLVFGVPFRGNPLVLLASSLLFLLTTLGIGLFLSTISETQQQAMMISFFFFMPAFMLSGFAFPIRNMPLPVQYLTYLNPVRYMIEIVRDVFLKGGGVAVLWPQMLTLLVYGLAILSFSALRFHKRLD
ncbi:MAG: ABC transporter permease [Acidobacteria bacterium]|nr:MAG: ABC transporter permease [Acidobacteriota bacterium]